MSDIDCFLEDTFCKFPSDTPGDSLDQFPPLDLRGSITRGIEEDVLVVVVVVEVPVDDSQPFLFLLGFFLLYDYFVSVVCLSVS